MSRYTTDRNGITVGWGNCFSYRDENKNLKHYYAIVSFDSLYPTEINSLNYNMKSFAHQIVWGEKMYDFPSKWAEGITETKCFPELRPWFVTWLDKNTPGWGVPPVDREFSREAPIVFFEKVTHARAFRSFVSGMLVGLPSVKSATLFGKKEK